MTRNNRFERDSFVGIEYYNISVNQIQKWKVKNFILPLQIFQIILYLLLMGICIFVFINWRLYQIEHPSNEVSLLTGAINGLTVVVLDLIYKFIIRKLVEMENHKYDKYYDASLATKRLLFSIVNSNISLMWTLYYDVNFSSLFFQIIGQIIIKTSAATSIAIFPAILFKVRETFK